MELRERKQLSFPPRICEEREEEAPVREYAICGAHGNSDVVTDDIVDDRKGARYIWTRLFERREGLCKSNCDSHLYAYFPTGRNGGPISGHDSRQKAGQTASFATGGGS